MFESCVRTDCVHALWASLYSAGWCDTDNDSFLFLTLQLSARRSALSRHITTEQWCKFACQMWKVLRVVMSIRRIINQICVHGQHPLKTLVICHTCISCHVSRGSCADLMIFVSYKDTMFYRWISNIVACIVIPSLSFWILGNFKLLGRPFY